LILVTTASSPSAWTVDVFRQIFHGFAAVVSA